MTRNTDKHIEIGQYPKNEAFPLVEPRWWANLILEPHGDADMEQGVQLIFHHSFDTEKGARDWAEMLDMMLAYGAIKITRTYQL